MSEINGLSKHEWIEANRPENGIFRAYWKNSYSPNAGDATLDPDEGEGLRYEWYYKDGKQHGESKGWFPNGQLKQVRHFRNGKIDGLWTFWYKNGQKESEGYFRNGLKDGTWTYWFANGKKKYDETY
jgi:antitoxin component YwqK of YwqJK toxin-antitoxin module